MNILILTDKLTTGGAENYFCKLENELFHPDMTFYTAAGSGELYDKIKNQDNFIKISRKNHLRNLLILFTEVKKKKIDMIHANSFRMTLYSIFVRFFSPRKFNIIYTKHNVTALEKKLPSLFKRILNKGVDKMITVSHYEKNRLTSLGVQPEKIKTVYNGVDLKKFSFQKTKKDLPLNIGILARISEEKNHTLFIQIANELRNYPEFRFYIAGDGPDFPKIKNLVIKLGLQDKVTMLGAVSEPEKFIKSMNVLLLTSHREVFPMVILEAMASGTPIISIDRGGIKEAIHEEETGFLLSNHSAREFSRCILAIGFDEHTRDRIINRARAKVEEEFSLKQMIQNTLDVYVSVGYTRKLRPATIEPEAGNKIEMR